LNKASAPSRAGVEKALPHCSLKYNKLIVRRGGGPAIKSRGPGLGEKPRHSKGRNSLGNSRDRNSITHLEEGKGSTELGDFPESPLEATRRTKPVSRKKGAVKYHACSTTRFKKPVRTIQKYSPAACSQWEESRRRSNGGGSSRGTWSRKK